MANYQFTKQTLTEQVRDALATADVLGERDAAILLQEALNILCESFDQPTTETIEADLSLPSAAAILARIGHAMDSVITR